MHAEFVLPKPVLMSYEVADVSRDTPLTVLLADLRLFLRRPLGVALAGSIPLELVKQSECMDGTFEFSPLDANATACDVDLFNVGAGAPTAGYKSVVLLVTQRQQLPPTAHAPCVLPPPLPPAIQTDVLAAPTVGGSAASWRKVHRACDACGKEAAACSTPLISTHSKVRPCGQQCLQCIRTLSTEERKQRVVARVALLADAPEERVVQPGDAAGRAGDALPRDVPARPPPRVPQPPPPPRGPALPQVPPPPLDALQALRRIARDGAGNTRPVAPEHNAMLRALCDAPVAHPPSANLPTRVADYRKLGAHLHAAEQQPIRCCFNCGMLNYPCSGDRIVVKARGLDDLRAWRVYQPMIEARREALEVPMEEIFLYEEVDEETARVFTCPACKKERCQDPLRYDLFDGHVAAPDGGWQHFRNSVGEPVPEPLAELTSEERLLLGVVKMADAAFQPAYIRALATATSRAAPSYSRETTMGSRRSSCRTRRRLAWRGR